MTTTWVEQDGIITTCRIRLARECDQVGIVSLAMHVSTTLLGSSDSVMILHRSLVSRLRKHVGEKSVSRRTIPKVGIIKTFRMSLYEVKAIATGGLYGRYTSSILKGAVWLVAFHTCRVSIYSIYWAPSAIIKRRPPRHHETHL